MEERDTKKEKLRKIFSAKVIILAVVVCLALAAVFTGFWAGDKFFVPKRITEMAEAYYMETTLELPGEKLSESGVHNHCYKYVTGWVSKFDCRSVFEKYYTSSGDVIQDVQKAYDKLTGLGFERPAGHVYPLFDGMESWVKNPDGNYISEIHLGSSRGLVKLFIFSKKDISVSNTEFMQPEILDKAQNQLKEGEFGYGIFYYN